MANSVLAKMAVQISANTAEFNKALTSTSNNLKNFTSNITNIAGTIGVAFGVREVLNFGLEVTKLAGRAEAVQAAFDRLPNSIRLMDELKRATGGTVSELELMQRAVQASNFDISLEALPRLLEFATLRAQQTGQSVDYLVDSIVTGIGRKSKLILDNLGISAAQLSEELNGVSTEAASVGDVAEAVGRIAEKNLVNMAGFSENAATKLQRLSASWENLKVAIGEAANSTGVFGSLVDTLSNTLDIFSSENITNFQKFQTYLVAAFAPHHLADFTDALKKVDEEINKINQSAQDARTIQIREDASLLVFVFGGVKEAIQGFREEFKKLSDSSTDFSKFSDTQIRQFNNFNEIIKVLQDRLAKTQPIPKNAIDTISEYREEIKKLTEQNEGLTISDSNKIAQNNILIDSYEKQIKKLQELGRVKGLVMKLETIERQPTFAPKDSPGPFTMDEIAPDGQVDLVENLSNTAEEVKSIQADLEGSTADFVSSIAETIGSSISGTFDFGKSFLRALANFGQQFGKQLIALGVAQLALKVSFKNPAAAIAAGVALVVASSAIAGSIKSFNGGVGSGNVSGSGGSGISSRSSTSLATNAAQNEFSLETAIKGQDLYVVLSNYEKNKGRTSVIGG